MIPQAAATGAKTHRRADTTAEPKAYKNTPSGGANTPPSASFQENNQDESVVETADSTDGNSYEYGDGEDPTDQLLTEYWTSFSANNQDESFVQIAAADSMYAPSSASFQEYNQDDPFIQIPTADNGYTSLNGLTFPPITPPQSLEDTSLPLESSQDIDGSNVHGHRRTRRSTRATARERQG
jgi:hypothetical protein